MGRWTSVRQGRVLSAALALCCMTAAPEFTACMGSRTLEAHAFDCMARVFASHGF
jgi:hypothetical protein